MSKTIVCKRCGRGGLIWAQTRAGKWYLTEEEGTQIRGESGRVIKIIRPAHRCETFQTEGEAR